MKKASICIVGVGRLGGALAIALEKCGYEIRALVNRTAGKAEKLAELLENKPQILTPENLSDLAAYEVIFITTPDSEIQKVAENLAKLESITKHKPSVFHTSGALSAENLSSLKDVGCRVGSFHPLVSISEAELGATRFADAYFCLEGDEIACETAKNIVEDLRGKSFSLETKFKTLYHASAVTACGHLVALFDTASEMLQKCGLESEKARGILFPLVKSTVENLQTQPPEQALTGTFARADVPTMQKHLAAIESETTGEILEIYKILGLRSIKLAEKQGANFADLQKMREILQKD